MRQRDERFATQARHRGEPRSAARQVNRAPSDARCSAHRPTFTLRSGGAHVRVSRGQVALSNGQQPRDATGTWRSNSVARRRDCGPCALRARCLRHPERTPTRQVAFFAGRRRAGPSEPHGADESAGSTRAEGRAQIRAALRDGRAGVRESAPQQAARSLHAARAREGRRAMEALLPRAQHREARAPRATRRNAPHTRSDAPRDTRLTRHRSHGDDHPARHTPDHRPERVILHPQRIAFSCGGSNKIAPWTRAKRVPRRVP